MKKNIYLKMALGITLLVMIGSNLEATQSKHEFQLSSGRTGVQPDLDQPGREC